MLHRLTRHSKNLNYEYSTKGSVKNIGNIIDNYGKVEDLLEKYGFENITQLEEFLKKTKTIG